MTKYVDVFVIGAGPAGLTAAYCLSKEGSSVLGHRERSGLRGRYQPHGPPQRFPVRYRRPSLFLKIEEVVDLWREILPDDFIERPRLSHLPAQVLTYPLGAHRRSYNLGLFTSAACMLSYAYAKLWPIQDARTFHQWVRNQFGEKLFSIFFKTYTEKVWGMSCDDISADWAAQRIKGLDLGVAVMNALKRAILPRRAQAGGMVACRQDPDRKLPVSAQGPRNDVGGRGEQGRGARRLRPDGP
jgi:protoporphyrinogen oxidase